jgi:hypothetical protein
VISQPPSDTALGLVGAEVRARRRGLRDSPRTVRLSLMDFPGRSRTETNRPYAGRSRLGIVEALDPDFQHEATGKGDPTPDELAATSVLLLDAALEPLAAGPELRERILAVRRSYEQVIDETSAAQAPARSACLSVPSSGQRRARRARSIGSP